MRFASTFLTLLASSSFCAAAFAQSAPAVAVASQQTAGPRAEGPPRGRYDAVPEVFARTTDTAKSAAVPPPRSFVTKHSMMLRGARVQYTATAGDTYVTNLDGEPVASIFSFAYVKDAPAERTRPVIFVFNGGPGSSSVWLHVGILGPKRVVLDNEVNPSNTPPFGLRDNPYALLDIADVVFIDPVGTGFSHAVGGKNDAEFFGIEADAESVARFIELWLTRNGRWNAPKYIVGESYGSVRAALMPRRLMGGPVHTGVMRGITVNGVVLLGTAFSVVNRAPPRDGPPVLDPTAGAMLPSFAATAFYHGKIDRAGKRVEQVFDDAKEFASSVYPDILFRLDSGTLGADEKQDAADRLAAMTGVPAAVWIQNNLRISGQAFTKLIIKDRGLDAGAYDSRYTLPSEGGAGDPVSDDPAMGRYVPGFVAAFHEMLTEDLKVDVPEPYGSIVWTGLNSAWDYNRANLPKGWTPAQELSIAMRRNPKLRVLVASGYYDVVTSALGAEQQVSPVLPRERVTLRNYESGHMLYLGDTAEAFTNDIRTLITQSK